MTTERIGDSPDPEAVASPVEALVRRSMIGVREMIGVRKKYEKGAGGLPLLYAELEKVADAVRSLESELATARTNAETSEQRRVASEREMVETWKAFGKMEDALATAQREREEARRVHLRRHTRLSEAVGINPGYSADATIDGAIKQLAALRSALERITKLDGYTSGGPAIGMIRVTGTPRFEGEILGDWVSAKALSEIARAALRSSASATRPSDIAVGQSGDVKSIAGSANVPENASATVTSSVLQPTGETTPALVAACSCGHPIAQHDGGGCTPVPHGNRAYQCHCRAAPVSGLEAEPSYDIGEAEPGFEMSPAKAIAIGKLVQLACERPGIAAVEELARTIAGFEGRTPDAPTFVETVEAQQWNGERDLTGLLASPNFEYREDAKGPWLLAEAHWFRAKAEYHAVKPGWWIVRHADGRLSTCTPGQFTAVYGPRRAPVSEPATTTPEVHYPKSTSPEEQRAFLDGIRAWGKENNARIAHFIRQWLSWEERPAMSTQDRLAVEAHLAHLEGRTDWFDDLPPVAPTGETPA